MSLTSLPGCIGNLSALTELGLQGNSLSSLPDSIGNLTALTYLDISRNQLKSLPESIGNLIDLEDLDISTNKLKSLPDSICNLIDLEALDIAVNQFQSLSDSIGNLIDLRTLGLSGNPLQSLPDSFSNLTKLRNLYLNSTQLPSLPESIGNLIDLRTLELSGNLLQSLPDSFGNLSALKTLDLRGNITLNTLPLSLGNVPGITYLSTINTAIPAGIVNAILAQCRARRDLGAIARLPNKIVTWQTFAKQKDNHIYSSNFLNHLSDGEKYSLHEWLVRLERTRDFHSNQADLTDIVCSMLETLETKEEFKELFFIQVNANLECCEDRAAMSLNEIYTSWKIHTMPANAATEEKLELLIGVAKTEELRIAISQNLIGKNESESVEIYLYYEQKLRDRLKLVTAIKNMRYATMGNRKSIDETALIESVEEKYISSLNKYPAFEKLAMNDPAYASAKRKIMNESQKNLEKIVQENEDHSGNLKILSEALQKETEASVVALSRNWVVGNSNNARSA